MNKLQAQVLGKRALIVKSSKEIRQTQQTPQPELKIESSPPPGQKEPPTVKRVFVSSRENLDLNPPKTDLRQAKSQQRKNSLSSIMKTHDSVDGSKREICKIDQKYR